MGAVARGGANEQRMSETKPAPTLPVPNLTAAGHAHDADFDAAAEAAAAGYASDAQLALLEQNEPAWIAALHRLLDRADDDLERAQHIQGPERDQVIADIAGERGLLRAALVQLIGEDEDEDEP